MATSQPATQTGLDPAKVVSLAKDMRVMQIHAALKKVATNGFGERTVSLDEFARAVRRPLGDDDPHKGLPVLQGLADSIIEMATDEFNEFENTASMSRAMEMVKEYAATFEFAGEASGDVAILSGDPSDKTPTADTADEKMEDDAASDTDATDRQPYAVNDAMVAEIVAKLEKAAKHLPTSQGCINASAKVVYYWDFVRIVAHVFATFYTDRVCYNYSECQAFLYSVASDAFLYGADDDERAENKSLLYAKAIRLTRKVFRMFEFSVADGFRISPASHASSREGIGALLKSRSYVVGDCGDETDVVSYDDFIHIVCTCFTQSRPRFLSMRYVLWFARICRLARREFGYSRSDDQTALEFETNADDNVSTLDSANAFIARMMSEQTAMSDKEDDVTPKKRETEQKTTAAPTATFSRKYVEHVIRDVLHNVDTDYFHVVDAPQSTVTSAKRLYGLLDDAAVGLRQWYNTHIPWPVIERTNDAVNAEIRRRMSYHINIPDTVGSYDDQQYEGTYAMFARAIRESFRPYQEEEEPAAEEQLKRKTPPPEENIATPHRIKRQRTHCECHICDNVISKNEEGVVRIVWRYGSSHFVCSESCLESYKETDYATGLPATSGIYDHRAPDPTRPGREVIVKTLPFMPRPPAWTCFGAKKA